MRKDVKLGFAIGGVLLAVLVVYVLVISGTDSKPEEISLAKPDYQAAPVEAADSSTQKADDPFHSSTESATATGGTDHWSAALNSGQLPVMMTQTPSPQTNTVPSEGQSSQPAAAELSATAVSNAPAALAHSSSPATQPAETRTHVIRSGETFSSIAAEVYGDAAYYPHLIRANPTVDPRKLRPGMVINLPPATQVRAETRTVSAETASTAASNHRNEYRVQSGDSLYRISLKLYGKADRADAIYELNKPLIGPDRNRLEVGMLLKLPEPPVSR